MLFALLSLPVVEVEEVVTTYVNPNNGSGPLWCYGASLLVRDGARLFVSAPETGEGVAPLCNTRWQLFERTGDGWVRRQVGERFEEREPCPLVRLRGGRLFLSTNPAIEQGATHGPSRPTLLEFAARNPTTPPRVLDPVWAPDGVFTEHSYRGIAADRLTGEVLLLNINSPRPEYYWSLLDRDGKWSRQGKVAFPIRACYPEVALRNGSAHILAIGDIVEPVKEWRDLKFEQTRNTWDYVFRRLFYTWTPDMGKQDFAEPVEVASVEATAGHISNLDLWLDGEGQAHLLFIQRNMQYGFLRDRFFPGQKMTTSLEWVTMEGSEVVARRTLLSYTEGEAGPVPVHARFHVAPGGRLYVVYYAGGQDEKGRSLAGDYLMQVLPEQSQPVRLDLKNPLSSFLTATERGGTEPSNTLELFGIGADPLTLRYARIRLRASASSG